MWCYRNKSFIVKGVTWRYGFYSNVEQDTYRISGRQAHIAGQSYRCGCEITEAEEYTFYATYPDGTIDAGIIYRCEVGKYSSRA